MASDHQTALLRSILESPQDIVIFALDREYRYMAFNQNHARTMKQIWGVDLELGLCMLDLIARPDDRERAKANFDRALAGESFTRIEEYGDERINRRFYEDAYSPIFDDAGDVIGLTVYLTDVTEQRQAEIELAEHRTRLEELVQERTRELEAAHAQLLYVQKLESLGVLAGGIAHDFNNLLAVVLGRAELAQGVLEAASPAQSHLDVIVETSLEARSLTRQLLAYAGRGKLMVQPTTLTELVEELQQVLRASVSKSIVLEYELVRDLPPVEVDVTQVRQVLLNLVTNAADAIGDECGMVTVRTYEAQLSEHDLQRACTSEGLSPGRHVALEVEDTGCGMDERVRGRLFDPFFTTKRVGRGLGLAAVHGIMTGHEGCIQLHSEPGRGSRFTMLFPASAAVPDRRPKAASDRPAPDLSERGPVLVVDDEHAVRTVAEAMLESLGYSVISVESGRQALSELRERQAVALVLLDLTMPHMNGQETLRELRSLREDLPVVLMTGFTEGENYLPQLRDQIDGFLAKPFSKNELVQALANAVTRAEARAAGAALGAS